MSPTERRHQLLEVLCRRRHDTCENLANEFRVSKRTIYSDIELLMCSYPVETVCGRYGGGVKVPDGFYVCRHERLTPKQADLLRKLSCQLEGDDLDTLNSILSEFAPSHTPAP